MFTSKLLQNAIDFKRRKRAYGYDVTGVSEEENQTNQRDTDKQREKVEDTPNPANISVDSEALAEFPEIRNRSNRIPSRRD